MAAAAYVEAMKPPCALPTRVELRPDARQGVDYSQVTPSAAAPTRHARAPRKPPDMPRQSAICASAGEELERSAEEWSHLRVRAPLFASHAAPGAPGARGNVPLLRPCAGAPPLDFLPHPDIDLTASPAPGGRAYADCGGVSSLPGWMHRGWHWQWQSLCSSRNRVISKISLVELVNGVPPPFFGEALPNGLPYKIL